MKHKVHKWQQHGFNRERDGEKGREKDWRKRERDLTRNKGRKRRKSIVQLQIHNPCYMDSLSLYWVIKKLVSLVWIQSSEVHKSDKRLRVILKNQLYESVLRVVLESYLEFSKNPPPLLSPPTHTHMRLTCPNQPRLERLEWFSARGELKPPKFLVQCLYLNWISNYWTSMKPWHWLSALVQYTSVRWGIIMSHSLKHHPLIGIKQSCHSRTFKSPCQMRGKNTLSFSKSYSSFSHPIFSNTFLTHWIGTSLYCQLDLLPLLSLSLIILSDILHSRHKHSQDKKTTLFYV